MATLIAILNFFVGFGSLIAIVYAREIAIRAVLLTVVGIVAGLHLAAKAIGAYFTRA
jgi:hypothetical protein